MQKKLKKHIQKKQTNAVYHSIVLSKFDHYTTILNLTAIIRNLKFNCYAIMQSPGRGDDNKRT